MLPIRQLRERKSLRQAELAGISGISQSYLSEIETGTKVPSILVVKKLAAALGVPVAALFDTQNSPNIHDTTPCPGKTVETGAAENRTQGGQ